MAKKQMVDKPDYIEKKYLDQAILLLSKNYPVETNDPLVLARQIQDAATKDKE